MSTLRVMPDRSERLTDRVAEEVRAQMARVRMTQTRLAEELGLPQSAISNRLRGKVPFTTDDLERIAAALGVQPVQLLGGVPNGVQPPPRTTPGYSHGGSTIGNRSATRFDELGSRDPVAAPVAA